MLQPYAKYTHALQGSANMVANTAVELLAAAANVRGVIVRRFVACSSVGDQFVALIAKATAPANEGDGDVLIYRYCTVSNPIDMTLDLFVPAGKALWIICPGGINPLKRNIVLDVL